MAVDFSLANANVSPISSLTAGIQAGQSMGFERQRLALAQQQAQQQAKAAAAEAEAAKQKQLIDYMGVAHETYKDLADVNPEHAFQFYKKSIAPLHSEYLKSHGIDADFSDVNPQEETPDVIKKVNEVMDRAIQDPSKAASSIVTLQQLSNMPSTGKMMKDKIAGSMKALGEVNTMANTAAINADRDASRQDKQDKANQDQWTKLLEKTNPDIATNRSSVGVSARIVNNAQRALETLNDRSHPLTYQDLGNIQQDLASIYQNGTPTDSGMKHNEYQTVYGGIAKTLQQMSGKPQDAVPENIRKQLTDRFTMLNGTAYDVINRNFDSMEAGQKKVIAPFSSEWQGMRQKWAKPTTAPTVPEITSKAAYDALPKGASYTHNGQPAVKK